MKKFFAALIMASLSLVIVSSGNNLAGDKEKAKDKVELTIGEVMKKAHVSKLYEKVAKGDASNAEKKALLGYYIALHSNVPPKGEAKDWEKVTKNLVDAAQAVLENKEGAGAKLAKLVNCAACHGKFKEKEKS